MTIDEDLAAAARGWTPDQAPVSDVIEEFIAAHEHQPGWNAWVRDLAALVLHERFRQYARRDRAAFYRRSGQRRFQEWEEQGGVRPFQVKYCVNDAHEWKAVPLIEQEDCFYIAADLDGRAGTLRLRADFMRALGRRIGRLRVGDVFDEDSFEDFKDQFMSRHQQ